MLEAMSRNALMLVLLVAGGGDAFLAPPATGRGRGHLRTQAAWCRGVRVPDPRELGGRGPGCSRVAGFPERGGAGQMQAAAYSVGARVEVRWEGEWWPATVQELHPRGQDGGAPEDLRVRFDGGSDEEWVKVASGDVRVPRPVPSLDEMGEAEAGPDAAYWHAAGLQSSEFTLVQAELLEELLEYRLRPGSRVMELGAGAKSVVPDRVESLYGIGLLNEQMKANKRLAGFETVELNAPGLTLNLPDAKFDAVLCNVLPYIAHPSQLLREARRCIKDDGIIVVSWSSISQHMMAKHWRDRTGSEQVALVTEAFVEAGLKKESLRVDISGPTDGDKLFVVSSSPSLPKPNEPSGQSFKVKDAVTPHELLSVLKDTSKKRKDARRQKEHDEKPFKIKVVSPPPETVLEGVYELDPRTHNGDKLKLDGNSYVVSRRLSVYSYRQGRYHLDQKVLEVQKMARYETNQKLNSLVDADARDAKSER